MLAFFSHQNKIKDAIGKYGRVIITTQENYHWVLGH